MIQLEVQTPTEEGFETLCTREYDDDTFILPEPRSAVTIPERDEDTLYIVQNVIHELEEERPRLRLIVQDQEVMVREMREQRLRMAKLQQLQQGAQAQPKDKGSSGLFTP